MKFLQHSMALAGIIFTAGIAGAAPPPPPRMVAGEVLVKFRPERQSGRSLFHTAMRAEVKMTIQTLGVELVKLPPGMTVAQGIALYRANPSVQYAEPNYIQSYFDVPNDTLFAQQWGAIKMRLPQAWDTTHGDASVVVAVIDSGTDINHPDFAGQIAADCHDFIDGDGDPSPTNEPHGTHVSGTVGATANNALGVAGMGWNCKVMGLRHNLTVAVSAAAMTWAADHGAKVVNMSYGYIGPPTSTESDAVDYAWGKGVLLVSAAGNSNYNGLDSYPNGYEKVLSVGATTTSDAKANFSDYGPRVDVAAPGVNILSTWWPGNGYALDSGTSMSSPGVAGVAALLFAYGGPDVTNQEVRDAIESTTDFVGTWLVHGRVNAERALEQIRPLTEVELSPAEVSVYEGTHASGDAASLELSDNNYYVVNAEMLTRVAAAASVIVDFDVPYDADQLRHSTLVLEASGISGATNLLFFYDWNHEKWVSFRQFALRSGDSKVTVATETYIKQFIKDGKLRMLSRAYVPIRRGTVGSFPFKLDQVMFETQIQN